MDKLRFMLTYSEQTKTSATQTDKQLAQNNVRAIKELLNNRELNTLSEMAEYSNELLVKAASSVNEDERNIHIVASLALFNTASNSVQRNQFFDHEWTLLILELNLGDSLQTCLDDFQSYAVHNNLPTMFGGGETPLPIAYAPSLLTVILTIRDLPVLDLEIESLETFEQQYLEGMPFNEILTFLLASHHLPDALLPPLFDRFIGGLKRKASPENEPIIVQVLEKHAAVIIKNPNWIQQLKAARSVGQLNRTSYLAATLLDYTILEFWQESKNTPQHQLARSLMTKNASDLTTLERLPLGNDRSLRVYLREQLGKFRRELANFTDANRSHLHPEFETAIEEIEDHPTPAFALNIAKENARYFPQISSFLPEDDVNEYHLNKIILNKFISRLLAECSRHLAHLEAHNRLEILRRFADIADRYKQDELNEVFSSYPDFASLIDIVVPFHYDFVDTLKDSDVCETLNSQLWEEADHRSREAIWFAFNNWRPAYAKNFVSWISYVARFDWNHIKPQTLADLSNAIYKSFQYIDNDEISTKLDELNQLLSSPTIRSFLARENGQALKEEFFQHFATNSLPALTTLETRIEHPLAHAFEKPSRYFCRFLFSDKVVLRNSDFDQTFKVIEDFKLTEASDSFATHLLIAKTNSDFAGVNVTLGEMAKANVHDIREYMAPTVALPIGRLPKSLELFIRSGLNDKSAATYLNVFKPIIEGDTPTQEITKALKLGGSRVPASPADQVASLLDMYEHVVADQLRGSRANPALFDFPFATPIVLNLIRARRSEWAISKSDEEIISWFKQEHDDLGVSTFHQVAKSHSFSLPEVSQEVTDAVKQFTSSLSAAQKYTIDGNVVKAVETLRSRTYKRGEHLIRKLNETSSRLKIPNKAKLAKAQTDITIRSERISETLEAIQNPVETKEAAYFTTLKLLENPELVPDRAALVPILLTANWQGDEDLADLDNLLDQLLNGNISSDRLIEISKLLTSEHLDPLWKPAPEASLGIYRMGPIVDWVKKYQKAQARYSQPKQRTEIEIAYSDGPEVRYTAGTMGDACYSESTQSIPDNAICGTLFKGNQILGNFLVLEADYIIKNGETLPIMVLRGINPLALTMAKYDTASLFDSIAQSVADTFPNHDLGLILDRNTNQATTNRALLHSHLTRRYGQKNKPIQIANNNEVDYNGYRSHQYVRLITSDFRPGTLLTLKSPTLFNNPEITQRLAS